MQENLTIHHGENTHVIAFNPPISEVKASVTISSKVMENLTEPERAKMEQIVMGLALILKEIVENDEALQIAGMTRTQALLMQLRQ